MQKKLLEGIRVADFTWHMTGPITTKHLSDLGAEVIIIESRRRPGWRRGPPRSSSTDQNCTSKLSVTLNTRDTRGLDLAKRIIAKSDIMVENFAGTAIARMGLGYDVVKQLKPDIIMLSTSMQGQTGPYATHPGSGHKLTALSGFANILGYPDRQPGWLDAYTDFIAPRYNIVALMAALEYRRRTGKGQYIDMSQYESGIHFLAPVVLDYEANKRISSRVGNKCDFAAPHNAYRCVGQDRWCAISVMTDEEWKRCAAAIGHAELGDDPRFSTLPARKTNEEGLDSLINEWTSTRKAEEVMKLMQDAGVPAGVVQNGEDLLERDPQLKYRGTFAELEYPGIGKYRSQAGTHFLMSRYKVEMKPAPTMGQHNEYVIKGILGMPDGEYDKLVKEGVID